MRSWRPSATKGSSDVSDRLRTNYDQIAGKYDIDRRQWVIGPDKVVTALLAEGRTDLRVLDVGCGTGLYLCAQQQHIGDAQVRWFGVDPSSQMLANAVAKAPELCVAQARAEALPVASGSIDYAYTSFVFHHVTDKDAALDEITRVLSADGRFRMRNMDPWGQQQWWLYRFFSGAWENDNQRFWPVERIRTALERRGFTVDAEVSVEQVSRTAADALDEAERRVISQLAILDDASYEEGIARLRAMPPDEEIAYPRAGLSLEAAKR